LGRRKRTSFGDVATSRAAFERGEARCANCRRPIGPHDQPTFVRGMNGSEPRLATMRCGRCSALLTLHFDEGETAPTT
jgi:hypothetical protein